MTSRQGNEVERIRTRYGTVTTAERERYLAVVVWGNGGQLPHLVVELDEEGRTVRARKIRSRVPEETTMSEQDVTQVMEAT